MGFTIAIVITTKYRYTRPTAGVLWRSHCSPNSLVRTAQKQTDTSFEASVCLVPVTGLEPVRCFQQGILSPWCLPFHHTGRCSSYLIIDRHGFSVPGVYHSSCCGSQNWLSLVSSLPILTTATRSAPSFRLRRRSHRSPHRQVGFYFIIDEEHSQGELPPCCRTIFKYFLITY